MHCLSRNLRVARGTAPPQLVPAAQASTTAPLLMGTAMLKALVLPSAALTLRCKKAEVALNW